MELTWFDHVLLVSSMVSNRLKCRKQDDGYGGSRGMGRGLGKQRKAALEPFALFF